MICTTTQEVARDPVELLLFAYQLRKIDRENKFSAPLMSKNIKPDALVDIFCANSWNPVI